jgi:hypothetical protein
MGIEDMQEHEDEDDCPNQWRNKEPKKSMPCPDPLYTTCTNIVIARATAVVARNMYVSMTTLLEDPPDHTITVDTPKDLDAIYAGVEEVVCGTGAYDEAALLHAQHNELRKRKRQLRKNALTTGAEMRLLRKRKEELKKQREALAEKKCVTDLLSDYDSYSDDGVLPSGSQTPSSLSSDDDNSNDQSEGDNEGDSDDQSEGDNEDDSDDQSEGDDVSDDQEVHDSPAAPPRKKARKQ